MSSNKPISEELLELMHIVGKNPNISQRQLAKELDLSTGKVNYCLRALMRVGLVKIENFSNSEEKINYVYILTPKGIEAKVSLTQHFLKRKIEEYEKLKEYL